MRVNSSSLFFISSYTIHEVIFVRIGFTVVALRAVKFYVALTGWCGAHRSVYIAAGY